jgi:hypothetical protein
MKWILSFALCLLGSFAFAVDLSPAPSAKGGMCECSDPYNCTCPPGTCECPNCLHTMFAPVATVKWVYTEDLGNGWESNQTAHPGWVHNKTTDVWLTLDQYAGLSQPVAQLVQFQATARRSGS